MRKYFLPVFMICFLLLGTTMKKDTQTALIPEKKMMQVGIIVKDVEKSAKEWAAFLGYQTVPSVSMAIGSSKNPTTFNGEPTDAQAKLAFFHLENITIELIEPVGGPSTWKEFLDTKGEGIHHIAFNVNGMQATIQNFEKSGIPLIQHGGWETGEYGYMDATNKLGLVIELLEHYKN